MKTIEEKSKEYSHSNLIGSFYVKENAYIQGAKDVLHELMLTMSVSEDGHLEDNLRILINSLKGNLTFEDVEDAEDELNF